MIEPHMIPTTDEIASQPETSRALELGASTSSAQWVVSLVMIKDVSPGAQNISNILDTFDATTREEALGRAIEKGYKRLPEHRLHVYTAMKMPNPQTEP